MNARLAKPIPSELVYSEMALDREQSLTLTHAKVAGFRNYRRLFRCDIQPRAPAKSDAASQHKYD
jgi:hypothetical protein